MGVENKNIVNLDLKKIIYMSLSMSMDMVDIFFQKLCNHLM